MKQQLKQQLKQRLKAATEAATYMETYIATEAPTTFNGHVSTHQVSRELLLSVSQLLSSEALSSEHCQVLFFRVTVILAHRLQPQQLAYFAIWYKGNQSP